jgi:methylmalonyl-CoA mutase cobalamin-binding subunit
MERDSASYEWTTNALSGAADRPRAGGIALAVPPETADRPDLVQDIITLVIAGDMEPLRSFADRIIVQSGGRDVLLNDILLPAARRLGDMWTSDEADFLTVTIGVHRLNLIMKETSTVGTDWTSFDHRILILPAPGEQHRFGADMVADTFREGGWCVRAGPSVTRGQLLRLVRAEWFDVIGFSVSADRSLRTLPATIRAVRGASCNPRPFILAGGHAISTHPERARFLGADATPATAATALRDANIFLENLRESALCATVTKKLDAFNTGLVDAG